MCQKTLQLFEQIELEILQLVEEQENNISLWKSHIELSDCQKEKTELRNKIVVAIAVKRRLQTVASKHEL